MLHHIIASGERNVFHKKECKRPEEVCKPNLSGEKEPVREALRHYSEKRLVRYIIESKYSRMDNAKFVQDSL